MIVLEERRPDGYAQAMLAPVGEEGPVIRRTIGGLAWPRRGRPGFLVVVGEAARRDSASGQTILHRLAETGQHGGLPLFDLSQLAEAQARLAARLFCRQWFALPCPYEAELDRLNRERGRQAKPRLLPQDLPETDGEALLAVVRKRVTYTKTLFFGEDSELPAALSAVPADIARDDLEARQEVLALVAAVTGAEQSALYGATPRKRPAAADSVAGY